MVCNRWRKRAKIMGQETVGLQKVLVIPIRKFFPATALHRRFRFFYFKLQNSKKLPFQALA